MLQLLHPLLQLLHPLLQPQQLLQQLFPVSQQKPQPPQLQNRMKRIRMIQIQQQLLLLLEQNMFPFLSPRPVSQRPPRAEDFGRAADREIGAVSVPFGLYYEDA